MAVKYLCDGCDKEVPYDRVQRIGIKVKTTGQVTEWGGDYELCKSCSDTLASYANPKNWVRKAPIIKRTA